MKLNPKGITPVSAPITSTGSTSQSNAPANDRRRRARQLTKVAGFIYPDASIDHEASDVEPWEVRITDFSKIGVGFITGEKLEVAATRRVRIGNGPARTARRAKIAFCIPHGPALFRVGAEFIA